MNRPRIDKKYIFLASCSHINQRKGYVYLPGLLYMAQKGEYHNEGRHGAKRVVIMALHLITHSKNWSTQWQIVYLSLCYMWIVSLYFIYFNHFILEVNNRVGFYFGAFWNTKAQYYQETYKEVLR